MKGDLAKSFRSLRMNNFSPKYDLLNQGLKPKKSFGQNFMMDRNINAIMVQAIQAIASHSIIIEIGAGTGSLTEFLVKNFSHIIAIERDRDLIKILKKKFSTHISQNNLKLLEENALNLDLRKILPTNKPGVLVGNIPYQLTSSIIFMLIDNFELVQGGIFLIQLEVAERICAEPNNKQYGFLTVILRLGFLIKKVKKVSKNAFWPVPKVDSAIISLKKRDNSEFQSIANKREFISFVRSIFQHRRKKLSSILKKLNKLDIISKTSIDKNLRPENLSPLQFLELFIESQKHS